MGNTFRKMGRSVVILFVTLFYMISGFLVGFFVSQILYTAKYSLLAILSVTLFVGIGLLIASVLHNVGQYLVGSLLGYKFLYWNFEDFLMLPNKRRPSSSSMLFYNLSGILLNLLVGAVILLIVFYSGINFVSFKIAYTYIKTYELTISLKLFFFFLAGILIIHSVINLTSFRSGSTPSKGKIIWSLLFRTGHALKYLYIIYYPLYIELGFRPGDIPLNIPIFIGKDFPYRSEDVFFILAAYYKALDSNDIKSVLVYETILNNNLSLIPDSLKYIVNCELCFINSIKSNSEKAEYFFNEVISDKTSALPFDIRTLRVHAYYEFYVNNNIDNTVTYANLALDLRTSHCQKGMIPLETFLLRDIIYSKCYLYDDPSQNLKNTQ